uniref:PH domain-containing protein n=1 Tax=Trichuris muris TaxID=70415 RepID=A0A5S6QM99_TRIMR
MRFANWDGMCTLAKDSSYPARMEGSLHVRESGCQRFVQRYVVLKGNMLFIFQKKGDKAPCLLMLVDSFNLDICEHSQDFNFRLNSVGGQETAGWIEFLAPSMEQFRSWIDVLISCSYAELSNGNAMFEDELSLISKATEQDDTCEVDFEATREPQDRHFESSRAGTIGAKYDRNQSFASLLSKFETDVLGRFYKKR